MTRRFIFLVWYREHGSALESLERIFENMKDAIEYVGENRYYRIEEKEVLL